MLKHCDENEIDAFNAQEILKAVILMLCFVNVYKTEFEHSEFELSLS